MQYRNYGKQGFKVSALGMGCMRLPRFMIKEGQDHADVDLEKSFEMIRYAAEHGINYFDTAFAYHNRTSEAILGEALDNGLRQKVKIATKLPFFEMKTNDDIRRNLENTLKKLRTDYIDIYLFHSLDMRSWPKIRERKITEEFERFRDEGLIRSIGFSYHGNFADFREILSGYPWDMCQIQQNLLDIDREGDQDRRRTGDGACDHGTPERRRACPRAEVRPVDLRLLSGKADSCGVGFPPSCQLSGNQLHLKRHDHLGAVEGKHRTFFQTGFCPRQPLAAGTRSPQKSQSGL